MGSPLSLNLTMYVMSSGGACTPLGCGSSHVTTREEGHSGVMERIVTATVGAGERGQGKGGRAGEGREGRGREGGGTTDTAVL